MSVTAVEKPVPKTIETAGAFARKLLRAIRKLIYNPRLKPAGSYHRIMRLGSKYGGWNFVDLQSLRGATIVSCGLGEDASFDVEFVSRFDAKVILVDPTPQAVSHYQHIAEYYGRPAMVTYTSGGKQPIEAYDLKKVKAGNFRLVNKALWVECTRLKFFSPVDPNHVSHSIVNFQNDYRKDSSHIEVEAITVDALVAECDLVDLALIKLDIEGAEIEVLLDMMKKKIFPQQILVEYDELAKPSKVSRRRILAGHDALLRNGYTLVHVESPSNFLYLRATAKA